MKVNEKLTQDLREQIGDLSSLNTNNKTAYGIVSKLPPKNCPEKEYLQRTSLHTRHSRVLPVY